MSGSALQSEAFCRQMSRIRSSSARSTSERVHEFEAAGTWLGWAASKKPATRVGADRFAGMHRLPRAFGLLSRTLLDVLAPRTCGACETTGVAGAFCPACRAGAPALPPTAPPVSLHEVPLLALGPFEPPLSLAIKRFKYSGRTDLARPLAELWWQRWRPLLESPNFAGKVVLVPVPLHPRRLVERGYNQSALLATSLARLAHARVAYPLLERVVVTKQQARLAAEARTHNLRDAFSVSKRCKLAPSVRLVLVDDVVTTGATLAACQAACRAADLTLSAVWTLAYTERSH